ncbi:MAG: hypothetical protein ABFS41_03255 [Myxococcota bacterium]
MQGSDVLQIIAEVAIALTGFTGIVVALRGREPQSLEGFAGIRFRILLIASLLALACALLPFFCHHLGASPAVTWTVCSAVIVLVMVPIVVHDVRAFRGFSAEIPLLDRRLAPFIGVVGLIVWGAQIANVLTLHTFAAYLTAPLWFLGFSALQFARLLLAPSPSGTTTR